ncbi:MAG: sensor histidine kinase, partial [Spirochaetota bacterium]
MSERPPIESVITSIVRRWLVLPIAIILLLVVLVTGRDLFIRLRASREQAYGFAVGMVGAYVSAVTDELVRAGQIGLLATASEADATQVMRIVLNRGSSLYGLILATSEGGLVAAAYTDRLPRGDEPPRVAVDSAFARALRTAEPAYAIVDTDEVRGPLLEIAVPLIDASEGRVARVMLGHGSWREVTAGLAAGVSEAVRVQVVAGGRVVADSIGFAERSRPQSDWQDGLFRSSRLFAASGLDYRVRVELDRAEFAWVIIANVVVIVAVAVVLLWSTNRLRRVVASRIVVPVQQLAYHAHQVEELGLRPNTLPRYVVGEIDDLAQSLQAMEQRIGRHVTDLVAADESNKLLLREVHHRVKNNLQMIRSLIHMQRMQGDFPDGRDHALAITETRVATMATVHESLVDRDHHYVVPLRALLGGLVNASQGALSDGAFELNATIDAPDISLDVERATSLGHIICEALTNAMIHAYHGRSSGDVIIKAGVSEAGERFSLTIHDRGPGCPGPPQPGLG